MANVSDTARSNVDLVIAHLRNVSPNDIVSYSIEHSVDTYAPRMRVEILMRDPIDRVNHLEQQRRDMELIRERTEIINRMMAQPIVPRQAININFANAVGDEEVSEEQDDEERLRRLGIR